ncbi:MAG: hypothetical protein M1820_005752 [Bogoriella megaspora]|nr:MAG: hypothetical protein M1820_005752 [Bogoriella megaspora]
MASEGKSKKHKSEKKSRKRKSRRTAEFSSSEGEEERARSSKKPRKSKKENVEATEPAPVKAPTRSTLKPSNESSIEPAAKEIDVGENAMLPDAQTHDSSSIEQKQTSISPGRQAGPLTDAAAEEAFQNFYLQKATEEFAEDLDAVRSAGDFSDRSLPILINALKQGTSTFSRNERMRIGRVAALKPGVA